MICRADPRPILRRLGTSGALVLTMLLVLSGCAAGTPAPVPAPTPSAPAVSVPAGGVSLVQLGFSHGPGDRVTLPAGVRPHLRIDQPNMVTVTFTEPDAAAIGDWLRTHLADGGFRITADGDGGIVFEGQGWQGAFTGTAQSALTLRRMT